MSGIVTRRNVHEIDKTLSKIQSIIDFRKIKEGHKVQLLLNSPTTREIIKETLNIKEIPNWDESKEHIMSIYEDKKKLDLFIDKMVYSTNGVTLSKRLEFTENILLENLDFFNEQKKLNILDIGVGATHSEKLKAVTTIELAVALSKIFTQVKVFGGDIRISEFEEIKSENVIVNLFPFDIFEPDKYMREFNEKNGFKHFDIVRCSNLLGHFKEEKRQIIINNLLNLTNNKALILFNTDYENIYHLFVKENNEIETKLIYL